MGLFDVAYKIEPLSVALPLSAASISNALYPFLWACKNFAVVTVAPF